MVIGLFAAMILCQVSLSIVLYTFSGFASDIFYIAGPNAHGASGDALLAAGSALGNSIAADGGKGSPMLMIVMMVIVMPLFLGIFTMMVYTITTTCFSLIHHLPDYIMLWIGGPQGHGASPEKMVGQIRTRIVWCGC